MARQDDHKTARKTTQFMMRMDPEFKAAAERAAAADHRSLASLIQKLLADYIEEQTQKR